MPLLAFCDCLLSQHSNFRLRFCHLSSSFYPMARSMVEYDPAFYPGSLSTRCPNGASYVPRSPCPFAYGVSGAGYYHPDDDICMHSNLGQLAYIHNRGVRHYIHFKLTHLVDVFRLEQ